MLSRVIFASLLLASCRPSSVSSTPDEIARAYARAVFTEDYDAAYALLASDVQDRYPADDYRRSSARPSPLPKSKREGATFTVARMGEERADVTTFLVVATPSDQAPGTMPETFAEVHLVRTSSGWRVIEDPEKDRAR